MDLDDLPTLLRAAQFESLDEALEWVTRAHSHRLIPVAAQYILEEAWADLSEFVTPTPEISIHEFRGGRPRVSSPWPAPACECFGQVFQSLDVVTCDQPVNEWQSRDESPGQGLELRVACQGVDPYDCVGLA